MGSFGPYFVERIEVEQYFVPVIVVSILIWPEKVVMIDFARASICTNHLAFMLEW